MGAAEQEADQRRARGGYSAPPGPKPATPTPEAQRVVEETGVKRFDAGKSRVELIEPNALVELGYVCGQGAIDYGEHNWLKGMSWSRMLGSAFRHLLALMRGEDIDPKSGFHHGAHLAWNALGLVSYYKLGLGKDDRFIHKKEPTSEKAREENRPEETVFEVCEEEQRVAYQEKRDRNEGEFRRLVEEARAGQIGPREAEEESRAEAGRSDFDRDRPDFRAVDNGCAEALGRIYAATQALRRIRDRRSPRVGGRDA